MDPIFTQLNSWKNKKIDRSIDLKSFELKQQQKIKDDLKQKQQKIQDDLKQKLEDERIQKEKNYAESHYMTHEEWLKYRQKFSNMSVQEFEEYLSNVEIWAKRQFGKTAIEYFKWEEYLENRTYEEFERDLYRREEDYLFDIIKFNAGIW